MATLSEKHWQWYQSQDKEQTCSICGKQGHRAYVQPQWKASIAAGKVIAYCTDCIAALNKEHDIQRKAELAAMPRCEVPGCKRRGSWKAAGVLLCGAHLKKAKHGHARAASAGGGLALFLPMEFDRLDVLQWAQGKE